MVQDGHFHIGPAAGLVGLGGDALNIGILFGEGANETLLADVLGTDTTED